MSLSVVCWNCRGAWTTRVVDPIIRRAVQSSDLFAVIDACVSLNHLSLISIPGYTLYYSVRSDTPALSNRVHGGVLLYAKNSSVNAHLTALNLNHGNNYDQLIVQIGDVVFAFVYMNQPQSTVHHRVPVPIWDNLLGELSNLYHAGSEKFIIMGDFNAHTSSLSAPGASRVYDRRSADSRVDVYGGELLSLCRCLHLQIANGCLEPGAATFLGETLQSPPTSVIDYMLFSQCLYETDRISSFRVLPPLLHLDHCPIGASISVLVTPLRKSRRTRLKFAHMPPDGVANEADLLLKDLMKECSADGPLKRVNPALLIPECASSAILRRRMSLLTGMPGFRENPALLDAYRGLSKQRIALQRTARKESLQKQRQQLLDCQGKREYWDFVRAIRGKKSRFEVDAGDAELHFRKLLNSLPPPPGAALASQPLPSPVLATLSPDSSAYDFSYSPEEAVPLLNDPITPDEVEDALKKMKNSANGEDRISVKALRHLDSDQIALFFYEVCNTEDGCLPASWNRSILIPIPKPGSKGAKGDCVEPKNLRGLSVQTLIRRLYSRCLVPRLVRWIEQTSLVYPTQTGFCKGFRTTDNLVILRTLHERLLASKQTLFLAFVDLEKAFDNVNRNKLWRLLHDRGGKGALVDSLHKLYRNTTTTLRLRGRYSPLFSVDKGVLQGDPLSPILFIMYIAEVTTVLSHPDDPKLNGLSVPDALLADDIMLPSTSAIGLQHKLDRMNAFFATLDMRVNPRKSKIMRMGCVKTIDGANQLIPPPQFFVNDVLIEEVTEFKFVGYNVIGGKSAKWQTSNYIEKCLHKARTVATSLIQLRRYIGPSNADFMMRLWANLADPYFVFAAEVSFDVAASQANQMDQVLLQYLRSAMGLPPKSIRILPLMDNAVFEVRHRRLELTARFVEYAFECSDDRPVKNALMDSMDLYRANAYKHGWYGSFASRVAALDVDPTPRRGLAAAVRKGIIKLMTTEWELLRSVASRMEIHRIIPTYTWHRKKLPYLRILSFTACRAIARIQTSSHNLMIERGRHTRVPRGRRLCPGVGCPPIVETEHHALNCCLSHEVLRGAFRDELFAIDSRLAANTEKHLLGLLVNPKKEWAAVVGRFFRGVLDAVDARYLIAG